MTPKTQFPSPEKKPLTIEQAIRRAVCVSTDKRARPTLQVAAALLNDDGQRVHFPSLRARWRVLRHQLFVATVLREEGQQS